MTDLREELRRLRNAPSLLNAQNPSKPLAKLDEKLHLSTLKSNLAKTAAKVKAKTPGPITAEKQTYTKIFHKTFELRMRYYYRLCGIAAFVLTLLLVLPCSGGTIALFPFKVLLIWGAFSLLKKTRDLVLTVESSHSASELQHIVSVLFSSSFLYVYASYNLTTLSILSLVFLQAGGNELDISTPSTTKTIKPFLNDNFMFFWFFTGLLSFFYSVQFLIFEKNRLNFKIASYREDPVQTLNKIKWKSLLEESASIAGCISLTAVPIYLISREFIFKVAFKLVVTAFNLNSRLPPLGISFKTFIMLSAVSFVTVFAYELLNKVYNAYATTGCLVVDKPLSTYSEPAFTTLMSGVTDNEPLVQLTAYQEIVYRATVADVAKRAIFYDRVNWTSLLEQMVKVIRTASKAAKLGLPVASAKKEPTKTKSTAPVPPPLFGRGPTPKFDDDDKPVTDGNTTTYGKVHSDDLFLHKRPAVADPAKPAGPPKKSQLQKLEDTLTDKLNDTKQKAIEQLKKQLSSQQSRIDEWSKIVDSAKWKQSLTRSYQREADRRIPNRILVGDCVVGMSEMLLHAKSEDSKGAVFASLTEVLNLLTRLYKSTSDFLQNPPVPKTKKQEPTDFSNLFKRTVFASSNDPVTVPKTKDHNAIKEINDLSLSYFFKLVIFYNSTLNDLILSPDTFKLAKWCTDVALEEQKQL